MGGVETCGVSGSLRARRVDAVLIAGPTACGKSALALSLAARLGGTIVNADSMQVYRDLRILTARPTADEEAQAPHALYGTIDGAEAYAVNRWLNDVATAMVTAREAGRLPIVVGGTGLYFKALVDGLSAIPSVPEPVRAEVRAMASTHAPAELYALLAARDPAGAARLQPTDPQRISRALEVHLATGRSLADYQSTREPPTVSIDRCIAVRLEMDRAALRERIDSRFERMVEDGALAEVAALAGRRLDPNLPVMRSIGVPALLRHLGGELNVAAAIVLGQTASRQYLKRQETFARHQLQNFRPIGPDRAETFVLDQLA